MLGSRSSDDEPAMPPDTDDGAELQYISVDLIERNPFQPRERFGEESLADLVASIRQHGVLQPVLVRRHGGRFQLIAGERRWLAARQAELSTIPCRIVERDDRGSTEAAIEENLKRKDLNPIEKARAFRNYRDRFGCSVEELAQKLSMQRSTVSNFLRLLELPEPIKQSLAEGRISSGHGRALLSLSSPDEQIALCRRIERESLSVRAVEAEVKKLLDRSSETTDTIPIEPTTEQSSAQVEQRSAPEPTPHLRSLQELLRQKLGVKVEIRLSAEDAGRIIIPFTCNDDFERIIHFLRRAA